MNKAAQRPLILLLVALMPAVLCGSSALAGTAYPGLVHFTEPAAGETVQIYNRGDEHFSYMTDTDGNLLMEDEVGYLRYVTEDGSIFAIGGYVTQSQERTAAAKVNMNTPVDQLQSKLQALMNLLAASRPVIYADAPSPIPLSYDFAGHRAEGRATKDCHYMTLLVGGKRVTQYTVIGELTNYVDEYDYDDKSGKPRQAQYGTATHEPVHDMGLPDLYSTRSDPVS